MGRGAGARVAEDEAESTERGRHRWRLDRFFYAGGDAGGGEGSGRRRDGALESELSHEVRKAVIIQGWFKQAD